MTKTLKQFLSEGEVIPFPGKAKQPVAASSYEHKQNAMNGNKIG